MIKDYSKFDKISEGVYGKRPVNDIASTCYQMVNVQFFFKFLSFQVLINFLRLELKILF